jgi:Outer membrane protein beta-barrel domain
VLFFLATFSTLHAQMDMGHIRFGLQLSPTFSQLSTLDKNVIRNGIDLGTKLGLVGEANFSENYSVTTGLGFSFNTGGRLRYVTGGDLLHNSIDSMRIFAPNTQIRYHIQYVEIPIGLKMRTQEFGYLRYYGEVPLTLGFRGKGRGDVTGTGITLEDQDIHKDIVPITLSWGFGGGVEYNISSSTTLFTGLTYQRSFVDITRNSGSDKSKANLGMIVLRLGILF